MCTALTEVRRMRTLLLFRGAPGVGKSTYIEKNGLKPYTLSADDIRLLCQSPVLMTDGSTGISQNNDNVVWKTLFTLLETRMKRGEFTVIDATNSKASEMNKYKKLCQEYRYRIFCIDMTDVPIEECKRRNKLRPISKQVPDEVIDKMYSRFKTQNIPGGIKIIKPDELDTIFMKKIDLSDYKKIHHIGDVHGANTALKEYLVRQYFNNQIPKIESKYWDYTTSEYWKTERWLSLLDFENEEWRDIVGFGGLYKISNYGRVKSLPKYAGVCFYNERILSAAEVGTYLQVILSINGKQYNKKIHRLVAEAFIENNNKEAICVNHKDLNRFNNNVENLEWTSHKENVQYSINLGTYGNMIVGQYNKNGNFMR